MALCREVVDLVRLHPIYDPNEAIRVRHIAIVQKKTAVRNMRVFVEVIDSLRVEQR